MKLFLTLLVVIGGSLLAACSTPPKPTDTPTKTNIEQKQGDTTKTGVVSGSEGSYVLQVTGEAPIAIDSYGVDLSGYVGQSVTVTGQYSGDTLFVGSVE